MKEINFGMAVIKKEGEIYNRYGVIDKSNVVPDRTQADYMDHGDYPTVAEMIEMLSKMPSDAKVCYYYDSHIHGSINTVFESNGGAVILTTDNEMFSLQDFAKPKEKFNKLEKYPDGSRLWFEVTELQQACDVASHY